MSLKEWENYKVNKKNKGTNERDCLEFSIVTHTTHISPFFDIINDNTISDRPIYDKCKIGRRGINVVWLSPKIWHGGFRYGNVQFVFNWSDIIKDMNYYWVECITDYDPSAPRILITNIDRSYELDTYDPTIGNGPWWWDKKADKHYVNDRYCLEIMLERSVNLSEVTGLNFVQHSKEMCCIFRKSHCIQICVDKPCNFPNDKHNLQSLVLLIMIQHHFVLGRN